MIFGGGTRHRIITIIRMRIAKLGPLILRQKGRQGPTHSQKLDFLKPLIKGFFNHGGIDAFPGNFLEVLIP